MFKGFPFHKASSFRKCVFVMAAVVIVATNTHTAHASSWGSVEFNAWAVAEWQDIQRQIMAAITGAFKQAVGQVMNTQITAMIGGGSGKGPMFITNWQTFLVSDPQKQTNVYMNDFFSMSTRGRNSAVNYHTIPSSKPVAVNSLSADQKKWFAQEGIVSSAQAATPSALQNVACTGMFCPGDNINYYKYQTDIAKESIAGPSPDMDLLNYVKSPSEVFNDGNWRGFNAFFSNSANNPFGYSLMAQQAYQGQLEIEQRKAEVQAIAYQGFKASMGEGGVVKTPGITIGQLVEKAQGFSFDSISSAQDWGQIISSGIVSAATMAINAAVQTGLNAATEAVQGGINEGMGQLTGATGGMLNFGSGSGSLANVDWSSGSGLSSEFSNGIQNFNTDAQSGLMGGSQVWGDMNFGSTNVGSATAPSTQSTYSALGDGSFSSLKTTPSAPPATSFIPKDTWKAPNASQTNDSFWYKQK